MQDLCSNFKETFMKIMKATLIIVKLYEEVKLTFAHLFSIMSTGGYLPAVIEICKEVQAPTGERSAFVTKKNDFSNDGLPAGIVRACRNGEKTWILFG